MEVEEDKISDEMVTKMAKKAKESFKTRPKRKIPEDLCTPEVMQQWKVASSYTAHKTASPVVNAIAQRAEQPDLVLSGSAVQRGGTQGTAQLHGAQEGGEFGHPAPDAQGGGVVLGRQDGAHVGGQ